MFFLFIRFFFEQQVKIIETHGMQSTQMKIDVYISAVLSIV